MAIWRHVVVGTDLPPQVIPVPMWYFGLSRSPRRRWSSRCRDRERRRQEVCLTGGTLSFQVDQETGFRPAPQSPWQNPYAERLIGSIRRECLDHVIVLSENHLRRVLSSYFSYYHRWRTHLSLDMDCPEPREAQGAEAGEVIELPEVGGFPHHYERTAA